MPLPGNGIFVVQGEMAMLVTAMRRSTRWGSHSFPNEDYDLLMKTFTDLRSILNQVKDLRSVDPATYLGPFLEVIRNKETTGPVTSLALSAIHKFLSYGLIDTSHPSVPATVEDIADAVTRARFVGTDHASDGVVLMKILQVLRTLMLSPEGAMLTDESVCEIMLSCFRICFETRLTELLRRNAEQCLRDMTQLIFMGLGQLPPEVGDTSYTGVGLSLNKRDRSKKKGQAQGTNSLERKSSTAEPSSPVTSDTEESEKQHRNKHNVTKNLVNEADIIIEPESETVKSPLKKHARHSSMDLATTGSSTIVELLDQCVGNQDNQDQVDAAEADEETQLISETEVKPEQPEEEIPVAEPTEIEKPETIQEENEKVEGYVNNRGVRFVQEEETDLQPYGLVCVRELFRFLISLCNPLDQQNTSAMVHLGLSLVGTVMEVSAYQIANYPSLLQLVKDPLCRNLTSLLSTERISLFTLDLHVSFLLFEALRFHLKYQLEAFLKRIIEIISADTTKSPYEIKEIHRLALEFLTEIYRIPGLCSELFLNFDCDVYCMNLFEESTKLLSKNVVSSSAYDVHTLSLEALMTVIEAIEADMFPVRDETPAHPEPPRDHVTLNIDDESYEVGAADEPTEAELEALRETKTWIVQGTELFNQKPERGIEFLQQHGVLATPLDPHQVAKFLRENPDLDKKMIGEYICKRSSRCDENEDGNSEGGVLAAFAASFSFAGLRVEQALRLYLECFRLPGEAPLIFLIMEKFAEQWHRTNGEPFANTDAAFRLAYAVIMLNMDQHNHNAKKLNVPMTVEDFVKNLRGCNGSGDFDQTMLEEIYYSIKNEEMVMPAERTGPVRDAYLWRVLQRRGEGATYRRHRAAAALLLRTVAPVAISALSSSLERWPLPPSVAEPPAPLPALLRISALLCATPQPPLPVDTVLLTLAKFTALLQPADYHYIAIGVSLGQSSKAQWSLRCLCTVAARHGDYVREGWRYLADILHTLFLGKLLPKSMIEAEDYLAPNGKVSLIREAARGNEAGLLSSLYSYIALGETGIRTPSPNEKVLIDAATECVSKCNLPGLLVTETKFLHLDSLQELVRALIAAGAPPDMESLEQNPELEDVCIFFLELLGQTLIQNRDRVRAVWEESRQHYRRVLRWAITAHTSQAGARGNPAGHGGAHRCISRALTALLRTSARLMRCDHCAAACLRNLDVLLELPYKLFYQQQELIACGIHDVIKTSAQNVHGADEWAALCRLLCAVAGVWLGDGTNRSEDSDDEGEEVRSISSESELSHSPPTQDWIVVGSSGRAQAEAVLRPHRAGALVRAVEALSLVVRDVAHVTPHNCAAVVRAVRLLARATMHAAKKPRNRDGRKSRSSSGRRSRGHDSSDEEEDSNMDQYQHISIQLLDLMHTLHSRTAQIFRWWKEEGENGQGSEDYDLWEVAWMPLLQGIAEYCTDKRKQVSNSAITYLQRALLAPGLSSMGGSSWRACFTAVLFPLLETLPRRSDTARANTIMCKVFLHHLSALSSQPSFPALWLRIVSIHRGLVQDNEDPLTEAARESLKNMILVMDSVKIFNDGDGYSELWHVTWEKIGEFLPTLKDELFPQANIDPEPKPPQLPPPTSPQTVPTLLPAQPNYPAGTPTLVPINNPNLPPSQNTPTYPQNIPPHPQNVPPNLPPQQNFSSHPPIIIPSMPSNIPQVYAPQNTMSTSPPSLGISQSPPTPSLISPTPGTVPIRNPLYAQGGLTSSVLLQPLNEMISTPIGASHSQIPILYPISQPTKLETSKTEPQPDAVVPNLQQNTILDISEDIPVLPVEKGELYSEYINNPYNEIKDISAKEATLYDPKEELKEPIKNPLLDLDRKSLSVNSSPMHENKAHFGSSDNIKSESSIFNFSNYFGFREPIAGSEVFDNLVTHEG